VKLGRLPATSYAEATWRRISILASVIGVSTLVFAEVGVVVQLKDATASPPRTRPANSSRTSQLTFPSQLQAAFRVPEK
jgi:hypothetical protein